LSRDDNPLPRACRSRELQASWVEKGSVLEKATENRKKDIHSENWQDIKRIKMNRVVGFRFGAGSAEAVLTPLCGLEIFHPTLPQWQILESNTTMFLKIGRIVSLFVKLLSGYTAKRQGQADHVDFKRCPEGPIARLLP